MTETGFSQTLGIGNASSVSRKTALVVDDSKLARYVLKEMLIEQGIKVETAESAEEALGALSAYKPDVIFMDHMMPGMDGFQAVQAIKNDPKTAKIPILMYTSKDEGVYVNQARALGAVGVLPKKLKPVQLERVLQQLNLIPSPEKVKPKEESVSDVEQASQQRIIKDTQHSLEELARSASEDLEKDSMRQLFRQLFVEQRDTIKQDQNELLESMVRQVQPVINGMAASSKKWQRLSLILFAVFIIPLYFLMPRVDHIESSLLQLQDQHINSIKGLEAKIANLDIKQNIDVEYPSPQNWEILQWALNQNGQVSFYEPISSAVNTNRISELLNQLNDGGFRGSLLIQFHEGDFCLKSSEGKVLLEEESSLGQCQFSKNLTTGENTAIQEMRLFVHNLNDEYANIDIRFEEMGFQFTLQDYPLPNATLKAKEWNRIAALNNRLQFELILNFLRRPK